MSVIAAHCAKTLTIASTAGSPTLQRAARLLLPSMIECVAHVAVQDDEASQDRRVQIVGEIWKAFGALFASTSEELRMSAIQFTTTPLTLSLPPGPRLLAVLLPTMTMTLEPSAAQPSALHTLTIRDVLAFAAAAPLAFKEATGKLGAETREVLESSVRQALGGERQQETIPTSRRSH